MRTVDTGFSRSTLDADGIVTTGPINDELPRTGEMVAEILAGIKSLVGSTPRPIMWTPGDAHLDPRGWQTLIELVGKVAVAVAIVADDAARVRLGAFPGTADALLLPVRIFGEEDEARDWLLTFATPLAED